LLPGKLDLGRGAAKPFSGVEQVLIAQHRAGLAQAGAQREPSGKTGTKAIPRARHSSVTWWLELAAPDAIVRQT